jgi:poly(glycerol-phosphate) alpha-glucosyltransferase
LKTAVLARWVTRKFTGVFEVSRRFSQSIAEFGQDELVVFGIEDEFLAEDMPLWKPLEVRAHRARIGGGFGYSPDLLADLISARPDLAHVHGIWTYASVAAHQLSQKTRAPYILSPHGMLDPWAIKNSGWKKRIARLLYEERVQSGAACFHAATERELGDIHRFGRRNPICIIPYGIDLPDLKQSTPSAWGRHLPAGVKKLLFLSRFHPKKGIIPMLEAWRILRQQHFSPAKDWRLILIGVGDGNYEDTLKSYCLKLEIPWADILEPGKIKAFNTHSNDPSVIFVGPQFGPRKTSSFLDSNAFILPSYSEGLPMVVLDAWAHARPVVMTPNCNLPEGFTHGAAIRIQPEAKDIARGLRQLFEMSDADRRNMGQKGLCLVTEKYVWTKVAMDMRSVYQWMLGGGPKPGCVV